MKDWRFGLSLVLAVISSFLALRYFGDELVAIVLFQGTLLLSLLTLDFDWKRLVAHDALVSRLHRSSVANVSVDVPPAEIGPSKDRVQFPSAAVFEHASFAKEADLRRSVVESEKFGVALADAFQKMLFVALISGLALWALRVVEKGLVDLVGASPHLQRITLTVSFLKVVSTVLPIALQLSLIWGACLYLRKRNLELSV